MRQYVCNKMARDEEYFMILKVAKAFITTHSALFMLWKMELVTLSERAEKS